MDSHVHGYLKQAESLIARWDADFLSRLDLREQIAEAIEDAYQRGQDAANAMLHDAEVRIAAIVRHNGGRCAIPKALWFRSSNVYSMEHGKDEEDGCIVFTVPEEEPQP